MRTAARMLLPLSVTALLCGCPWDGKESPQPTPPSPPPAATYTLGGSITGLTGSVTLANNGGDSRTVTTAGAFTFATALQSGAAYSVTVTSQPATQTCTVGGGTGSIAASNVTNVAVTCITKTYPIGGSVSGLAGAGLVLQNNGGDNLARNADGAFTFATSIAHGSAYNVTVLTQPSTPAQVCTPTNNTGTATAAVANVAINCITPATIGSATIGPAGGTVDGLYGAKITVPAGALATAVTIGLSRDSSHSPAFSVSDIDAIGATYELTPHGQTFSTPVTLHIPFDPLQVPNDADPVLYKAEMGGAFTALPTTINGNFLDVTVTGFSWVIPAAQATKPRMVYAIQAATGPSTTAALAAYKIDKITGALSAVKSTAVVGEIPTAVIAHPSRRFVYVAHGGNFNSTAVNGIPPNSIAVYQLSTVNGNILGSASATAVTSAPPGIKPTVPVIHPNGKFLYVSNFGSVSFNGGGDIDQFAIDGATGALTRSPTVISGGGAQPMGIVFNRLGTIAYVLYSGTSSSNSFSSQVKAYTVDTASGAFTGPISGVAAGVLGSYPWSIAMDPNNKFVYVSTFSTDELIAYSVNSSTGALSNIGSLPVTAGSKLVSLAIDSFARFLFVGRQQPWLSKNLLSYQYNAGNGALTAANTVLTPCPGGGCVGAINVVAEPQGQFVYAVDSQRGLGSFAVDQTTGALTAVNSVNDTATMPVAATGASPVWQSNCTHGCALSGAVTPIVGGGGGGPAPTNPSPPTSHFLTVTEGAFFGFVTSSPAGIDYGPPTIGSPIGPNAFSAIFAANSSVQLCTTPPPQPAQAYDITWTGSCSGTSSCTTVTMTSDKYCHIEFTPASLGVH